MSDGPYVEERDATQPRRVRATKRDFFWLLRKIYFGDFAPEMSSEEQPKLRSDVITVYFPGFSAARSQASKYVAEEDGITVLDDLDESKVVYVARCPGAPRLLHNVLPAREVPEIRRGFSLNPIYGVMKVIDMIRTRVLRMAGAPAGYMSLVKVDIGGLVDQAECLRTIKQAVIRSQKDPANPKKIVTLRSAMAS